MILMSHSKSKEKLLTKNSPNPSTVYSGPWKLCRLALVEAIEVQRPGKQSFRYLRDVGNPTQTPQRTVGLEFRV